MKGDATTHTTNAKYRAGWEAVFGRKAIPDDRDLNTVTAEEWAAASVEEREAFTARERTKGYVSFVCLRCGFPTAYGQVTCESCDATLRRRRR